MTLSEAANQIENVPSSVATTRWSLILAGAEGGEEQRAQHALAELCRTYWRPIFGYICRRGFRNEDAQDLAQDFFAMILAKNWLRHADRNRGRFRSLLFKSLKNFLVHELARRSAWKRGGKVDFVSWDAWMLESPSQLLLKEGTLEALGPEEVFDLRWAATVVEQALQHLKEECEAQGRRRLFETLSAHLTGARADISYSTMALQLGVAETIIKKQLYLLRQRFRTHLRTEVAETVADPNEIDDEIRYLCQTLAKANS